MKANLLNKVGKYDDSLNTFDSYIARNPHFYQAYRCKAELLEKLNRYDEAVDTLDICIQGHPSDFDTYKLKAELFIKLNKFDSAIQAYVAYLTATNNQYEASTLKARILTTLEIYDPNASFKALNNYIENNLDCWYAYELKYQLFVKLGRFQDALFTCDAYMQVKPDFFDI